MKPLEPRRHAGETGRMMSEVKNINGINLLLCGIEAPKLETERDVDHFLGEAWGTDASLVAIPLERLGPGFFDLANRSAGAIIQKFVNYRIRLVILGDVTPWTERSKSVRDFVYEANRRNSVWFLRDWEALEGRLAGQGQSAV